MTIGTKYNIGDEVWAANHECCFSGKVTSICVYIVGCIKRVEYRVFVGEEMHFTFNEQDLFPTKEELIKSL